MQVVIISAQQRNNNFYNIHNDTTWSADTILIFDNVIINDSATLTISPGVYIEFHGKYHIEVNGLLDAMGTLSDSIVFNIYDTTGFADTATIAGGWGGIRFMQREGDDTSVLSYCKLQYGKAVKPGFGGPSNLYEENKGGCIYASNYSNIIVKNSSIVHNHSNYGGGALYFYECNSVNVNNCEFKNNFTYNYGGGIYLKKVETFFIKNNIFIQNTAYRILNNVAETGSGSGVYLSQGAGSVLSNKFFNNKSLNGALYESSFSIQVINNIVANNYGIGITQGSGYTYSSLYANNIVVNNWGYIVPAIWFHSDDCIMINNIIWGNGSDPSFGYQIWSENNISANISFSCIQDGYNGEGNIETYPEFLNPTEGYGLDYDASLADWTLLDTSPCINKGMSDTGGLNLPELDIAGNPRIFGNRIDMSAYENQNVYVHIKEPSLFAEEISIYPNPGRDQFHIEIKHGITDAWIELVDINGKQVFHAQLTTTTATFSPTGLNPGMYFYRIYNKNQVIKMGKWIKQQL